MKIREAIEAHNYISALKLNKLDKEIRLKLVKNYPILDKIVKENEEYKKTLQEKMFEDHKEDAEKVQELRAKVTKDTSPEQLEEINKEAKKYESYLKLEIDFIKCLTEHLETEVTEELSKISKTDFIENLTAAEVDFTLIDLLKIDILFK